MDQRDLFKRIIEVAPDTGVIGTLLNNAGLKLKVGNLEGVTYDAQRHILTDRDGKQIAMVDAHQIHAVTFDNLPSSTTERTRPGVGSPGGTRQEASATKA